MNILLVCACKKSFFLPLVVVVLFSVSLGNRVDAGCGWFCGCDWYVSSSTPSVIDKVSLPVSNAIGGCNAPGETPPKNVTCTLATTSATVTNWQVTGSLTGSICSKVGITIGGTIGATSTVKVDGGVGATLTYFCQTCQAENGTRFNSTAYRIRCSCGSGRVLSGSVIQYVSPYLKASTGHTPNPPCNPECPPPA